MWVQLFQLCRNVIWLVAPTYTTIHCSDLFQRYFLILNPFFNYMYTALIFEPCFQLDFESCYYLKGGSSGLATLRYPPGAHEPEVSCSCAQCWQTSCVSTLSPHSHLRWAVAAIRASESLQALDWSSFHCDPTVCSSRSGKQVIDVDKCIKSAQNCRLFLSIIAIN